MLQIHWHSKTWFKLRFSGFDDEWIEEKLGNLVQIKSGECTKNLITGIDNSIPYFKVEQLNNSLKYQIKTPYFINDKSKIVNKGSIIFPKRGAAILLNKIRILNQDSFMDTNLMTLTPNNKLYNEFLYYFIYKENLSKIADTTSIPQLNNKHIKPYPIKLPSFEEQLKISKFISSVDKKVALLSQNLEIFNDFKKGLLQQIFTQKLRFNFNDAWKTVKIKDIFDERSEKGFLDLELLSVTLNDGVIKRSEIESKDNSNENKSNYKHVLPGDIVYNSMRMWQGASGVSPYEGIVSPAYTILIPKNVYSKYFGYYFKTNEMVYQFKKYSQGLTSDTWNLKYPLISEIKIKIPSIEEQKEITNVFEIMDEKIKILQNNIDELTTFKKGLLQQMFIVRINWRCNFKLAKSPSFNKHLLILKNKIIFIIIK